MKAIFEDMKKRSTTKIGMISGTDGFGKSMRDECVKVNARFGIEILSHDAGAIDLSRLAGNDHPLLLNHDRDQQIGVVERAWIDTDHRARATVRCM